MVSGTELGGVGLDHTGSTPAPAAPSVPVAAAAHLRSEARGSAFKMPPAPEKVRRPGELRVRPTGVCFRCHCGMSLGLRSQRVRRGDKERDTEGDQTGRRRAALLPSTRRAPGEAAARPARLPFPLLPPHMPDLGAARPPRPPGL